MSIRSEKKLHYINKVNYSIWHANSIMCNFMQTGDF